MQMSPRLRLQLVFGGGGLRLRFRDCCPSMHSCRARTAACQRPGSEADVVDLADLEAREVLGDVRVAWLGLLNQTLSLALTLPAT